MRNTRTDIFSHFRKEKTNFQNFYSNICNEKIQNLNYCVQSFKDK